MFTKHKAFLLLTILAGIAAAATLRLTLYSAAASKYSNTIKQGTKTEGFTVSEKHQRAGELLQQKGSGIDGRLYKKNKSEIR